MFSNELDLLDLMAGLGMFQMEIEMRKDCLQTEGVDGNVNHIFYVHDKIIF